MSDNVRYEVKFQLDERLYSHLQSWIYSKSPFVRSFPTRLVNSLYFDDVNYSAVKDNLSGIAQRSKFRLRWYGDTLKYGNLIFEQKLRNGRVGKKNQINLPKELVNISVAHIHHISKAVNSLYQHSENQFTFDYIHPTLLVSYFREYFVENDGVRITIDQNLQFAAPLLEKTISQHTKLKVKNKILEVKFNPNCKEKAQFYVSQLGLTPIRNSKYLTGLAVLKLEKYL